ncbi:MAG: ion channel [Pseudomonadota bacterium]
MTLARQVVLGSLVLLVCAAVHIAVLVVTVHTLEWVVDLLSAAGSMLRLASLITLGFLGVLLGHSLQIWIWAFAFRARGAIADLEDAIYFALVTTSTLGYGDITLAKGHRLFGAIASVSGLLTFGLSTAFLIEILTSVGKPPPG